MARSLSTTETKLYAADGFSVHLKVIVKDETGADLTLTDLEGRSWVESVDISDDIDQPVSEASVTLIGFEDDLNLSPTVTQSKVNRPGGSLQARLGVNREIKIWTHLVPEHGGDPAPASIEWRLLFHGDVDEIDIPSDGTSSQIRLRCRDLGGRLQRRWMERTGEPPTSSELTVAAYQTEGREVEAVMGDILLDWAGGVPLDTPVSPGWQIPQDSWEPEMTNVLDVLRSLAARIGWEVRYRWDSASSSFKLRFYEPPRSKTIPDFTLGADQYFAVSRFADSLSGVRNRVEVFYRNGTTEEAETKSEVREDTASQAKYGLLYSSIGENETTGITDAVRAGGLAELVLSDLKEPRAQLAANAIFLYQVEIHDLIRFEPNGLLFDTNQDLAVIGYRHHFSADRVETEVTCRPGVSGRWKWWWDQLGDGDLGESVVAPPAPVLSKAETIRGVKLAVTGILRRHGMVEWHVSTTTGFTPDSTTLKARGRATSHALSDLAQGTTYYAKARVIGPRNIPSAPSNEVSFTPGKADLSLDVIDGATHKRVEVGTEVNRPAYGTADRIYLATDTAKIYRDSGTAWENMADVTASNTAAAIVNQGSLATLSQVDTAQIAAGAVQNSQLAANAVQAGNVLAGQISNSHIDAAAGIVGTKLIGGAGVLTALETATGRLVDPEIKDGTGSVHRKLKNVGGAFKTYDASDVEKPTVFGSETNFEKKISFIAPSSDPQPYAEVYDRDATNMIVNPSFEVNVTDGWDATPGATVTQEVSISNVLFGSAACKVVTDGTVGAGIKSDLIPALVSQWWTFSIHPKASGGPFAIQLKVEVLEADGITVIDTWTRNETIEGAGFSTDALKYRIYIYGLTSVGTAYVRFYIIENTGTARTFYLDGAMAENNLNAGGNIAPTSYFDGTFGEPGFVWNGAAHNSTSTRTGGHHALGPLKNNGGHGQSSGMVITDNGVQWVGNQVWVGGGRARAKLDEFSIRQDGTAQEDFGFYARGNGAALIGTSGAALRVSGAGTSFPAAPSTNDVFFRTDFKANFVYDGSSWVQMSVGAGTSFPASPTTSLRFFRTDMGMEFYYSGSAWLTSGFSVGLDSEIGAWAYTSDPGSVAAGSLMNSSHSLSGALTTMFYWTWQTATNGLHDGAQEHIDMKQNWCTSNGTVNCTYYNTYTAAINPEARTVNTLGIDI